MKKFKEWLNEIATSTSCVANFSRPVMSIMTKKNKLPLITFKDYEKKIKKL